MAGKEDQSITYSSTGVNYDVMDPFKRLAQSQARETSGNIKRLGMKVVEESRGESAFVIDEGRRYSAHVIEGLGTKNLAADKVRLQRLGDQSAIASQMQDLTGRTYYDAIGQDTVAMIINDLISVGADPVSLSMYCAVGDSDWFKDARRSEDLVMGIRKACDMSGAVWGGGETPTLSGIIYPSTIDLGGSAYGIIKPKKRLAIGNKLTPGDAIFLVESSGIHANGLSLARAIAAKHPEGYAARLSNGNSYGESLLVPTHIYAGITRNLLEAGIDIHYMSNITGHGWRKLMRADRDLSYVVDKVPRPQPVFDFIQEYSGNDDEEMYGNFNMGAGFAIFMPEGQADLAQKIAFANFGLQAGIAGHVESGPKRLVIKPKGLVYKGETLGVR